MFWFIAAYVPDSEKPVWSICPTSTPLTTDTGQPTATYSWIVPNVTDDRRIVTQFESHTSPFAFPIGITDVEYRATDEAGNVGLCEFTVTVTGKTIYHRISATRSYHSYDLVADMDFAQCNKVVS